MGSKLMSLSPLSLYILFHLKKANVDYAGSISKVIEVPIDKVVDELDRLETAGLIQRRMGGSSIKRSEARFKLSDEVHKHHVYYELSREGEGLVRGLMHDPQELCKYFEHLTGHRNVLKLLLFLFEVENEHAGTLAKVVGDTPCNTVDLLDRLEALGLVVKVKEKVIKASHRKAKPKPETRTHHVYYRVSELTKMLIRYSGLRRAS
ncbi:DUF2250 domain-containing protein [Acidilobus sp.]|uniref:DUF2250 domain-containing protein n=1 Tax=Acidilobus sp. TaxID=1872109 RepID=UPI003D01A56A